MELGHWLICLICFTTSVTVAQEEADVRLVEGDCQAEGQVEIYHNGTWGTICRSGMSKTEADVICRSLPASFDGGYIMDRARKGNSHVWLTGLVCSESFHSVSQCLEGMTNWADGDCENNAVTWVRCTKAGYDDTSCSEHNPDEDGEVRIQGACNWQGQLQVAMDGQWGTVCANNFDDKDAAVACRQLKFANGWSYDPPDTDSSDVTSLAMVNVNCSGTEKRLDNCPHQKEGKCTDNLRAGILCSLSPKSRVTCDNTTLIHHDGDLQLLGGGGSDQQAEGLLQVFYHGHWGDFCGVSTGSSPVALCRMLGFSQGKFISAIFAPDKKYVRGLLHDCHIAGNLSNCQYIPAPKEFPCKRVWLSCSNEGPPPTPHPCTPNPCMNGGSCSLAREGQIHCHCPPTYTGSFCDRPKSTQCTSNPCQHNGTCVVGPGWYTCHCAPSYTGHHCQIEATPLAPSHHAMTTVAIVLGVLFVLLLLVVIGLTIWFVRGKYNSRTMRGMQRLDEEMSVISDQHEDFGDELED